MPVEWFDALSEQRVFDRAEREMKNAERYKSGANPQIAERAGQIYRQSPWMTPSQVLALAKGGASDQAVQLASDIQAKVGTEKMDPNRPDDKNWFERNIYDKFKAGTRWSFAALDLVPDLAQNVASQVFSQNDPAGFDGWFASTKLGTMLSAKQGAVDPETGQPITAGEGFFIGKSAEKLQAERARRVRGTINGSAWTIGRGAANVVFTPGSKGYSIASGLLDAVVLVGADPTVIGGKITAPIRGAKALLQGVRSADEAAGLAKLAQAGVLSTLKNADRAAAGLTKAESLAVDGSKFIKFWTKDARARRLVTYLASPENNDPVVLLRDVFKGKLDINTAKRFAAAKDENEVLGILAEVSRLMDEGNPRMLPTDIREIPAALRKSYVAQRVPLWNSFRRSPLMTQVPDQVLVLGDDFDNTKAVLNAANYLDTLGTRSRTVGATVEEAKAMTVKGRRLRFTETEEGKAIMGQIIDAYSSGDKSAVKKADEAFDAVVKTLLSKNGATDAEIADIFAKVKLTINDTRAYFINAAGEADDGGWFAQMLELDPNAAEQFKHLDPDQLKQLRMNGPGSVLELIDRVHVLPDIREVRRVTANPLIRKAIKRGDETGQRALVEYSEYLQNKIWKPITLATGGYILRNMIDAQTRIAINGLDGFFNHPYRYIQWVLMKRGAADITGKNFDQVISSAVDYLGNAVSSNYDEALTFSLKKNLEDPVSTAINAAKARSFSTANKLTNRDEWFTGLVEELIQISKDGMMNAWAKGIPTDDLLEYYRSTETGRKFLDQFVEYLRNGVNIVDENGYSQGLYKVADPNDDVIKLWIDRLIGSRVELKTASDADVKFATGYRRVPLGPLGDVNAKDIRPQDIIDGPKNLGRGSLIRTVDDDGKEVFAVVSDVKTVTRPQSQIIPGFADETEDVILSLTRVSTNDIVDSKEGRIEFAKFLRSKVEASEADATVKQFPKWTKVSQKAREQDNSPEALKLFDKFTDWFFQGVYGGLSKTFERSPVFRQFYYDEVTRNIDYLTKDSAQELLTVIKQKAKDFEMSPERYVGGRDAWRKIKEAAAVANGEGTIDQLDDYAQMLALNKTKETLYNASTRNNLEDIMRIIVPFGVAYREVMGTYIKLMAQDPTRIRRGQLLYYGAENFDPDADGQGFFYKDPTSGEMSFNFPLSGELTKLLTGVNAPLQAPVKRVSIGLQVIPSLGPVGQIAASQLIPDTPTFDEVSSILLPYGRDSFSFAPSWSRKILSALKDDPGKLQSIYGNTYVDVVRALSTSGDYDLDDEQSKANLLEDAKLKARVLTGLRGLAQFIGPAAPSLEYMVETDGGDVYASAMVQEFYRLQNENYDTAVSEFLRLFGEDAILYLSSKSKSVAGGLEATEAFGDWERSNEGLLTLYPDVAGYFAPGGDDFSFEVWDRQLRSGRRERLSAKEVIDNAQYKMGSALYRAYRQQVGAYPTDAQRAWLASARREISKRYPGFPATPVFTVGEFEKKIQDLRNAVQNESLADNAVAQAVATYLNYRDQAIAQYVAAGGQEGGFDSAKRAEPLRDYLVSIGQALVQRTPDFARIWDRELSNEVDK